MTKTTVTTKVHETFDIHGDLGPQFALNLLLVIDHPPDIVDLTVSEVIRFCASIDFELFKQLPRTIGELEGEIDPTAHRKTFRDQASKMIASENETSLSVMRDWIKES